jgi:uncharacterized membrane protein
MDEKPENPVVERPRNSIVVRLRNYFLTGVVVAAPISLTLYLLSWFILLVDTWFVPLLPEQYRPEKYLPFAIPGLGLIIAVVLLTLLGAFAANFLGQTLLRFGEKIVNRLPIVRSLYGALKQIFETVISQSSPSFRNVAIVEYPSKGIYSVCFVTSQTGTHIADAVGQDLVSVFIPLTPNVTSGYLRYYPRSEVRILDMTIEEGAKLIVSAGLIEPARIPMPQPERK